MIEREGAGQLVVIGPPNSGKSALLAALTHAPVEVTDYPFTTRKPIPGSMKFEDVPHPARRHEPSIAPEFLDPFLAPLIRQADGGSFFASISRVRTAWISRRSSSASSTR